MNNFVLFKVILLYNFITKFKKKNSKFCPMADVGRFCKAVQTGRNYNVLSSYVVKRLSMQYKLVAIAKVKYVVLLSFHISSFIFKGIFFL